jgi:hypothetical protein
MTSYPRIDLYRAVTVRQQCSHCSQGQSSPMFPTTTYSETRPPRVCTPLLLTRGCHLRDAACILRPAPPSHCDLPRTPGGEPGLALNPFRENRAGHGWKKGDSLVGGSSAARCCAIDLCRDSACAMRAGNVFAPNICNTTKVDGVEEKDCKTVGA